MGTSIEAASTGAFLRAADALLRSAGGRSVFLRIPSPAIPGDTTEQLGLATPTFQDVELAPVALRKALPAANASQGMRWELFVSATAIKSVVGSLEFDSANVLFANAFGILAGDTLMEIEAASASEVFGTPYVYRLVLRASLSQNL